MTTSSLRCSLTKWDSLERFPPTPARSAISGVYISKHAKIRRPHFLPRAPEVRGDSGTEIADANDYGSSRLVSMRPPRLAVFNSK
jgi:hypothetical protein